jgi:hypothetical protein
VDQHGTDRGCDGVGTRDWNWIWDSELGTGTWNWNLKLELETWNWNWGLKLELGTRSLDLELEVRKLEYESRNLEVGDSILDPPHEV